MPLKARTAARPIVAGEEGTPVGAMGAAAGAMEEGAAAAADGQAIRLGAAVETAGAAVAAGGGGEGTPKNYHGVESTRGAPCAAAEPMAVATFVI